jgi:glutathione peroxidase
MGMGRIKWNFEKFLLTKQGKVYDRWSSVGTSLDEPIEKLLKRQ